ncbi:MAG: PHP domain-containing protein [Myxococcales bacterium]|nr:PHP domain-containing protein [Myxococcales bacterium]
MSRSGISSLLPRWLAAAPSPALLLAFLGLCAVGVGACPAARPGIEAPLERGGVRVERIGRSGVPFGPRVQGLRGDYLMSNGVMSLIVRARREGPDNLAGTLVDATSSTWLDDQLNGLGLVIEVDGIETPTLARRVEVDPSGPLPRLRIVRETRDRTLIATSTIELRKGERWAEVSTRVENKDKRERGVRVGDRLAWYGAEPFAPGFGFVGEVLSGVVPWFAHPGQRQSYALAFPDGPVTVSFSRRDMGGDEQLAMGRLTKLAPGAVLVHRRRLVVAQGPLEVVAEHAWRAQGAQVGFVVGELEPAPSWAMLELRDAAGRVVSTARVNGAHFALPAPAGTYQVALRVAGGSDRQQVEVRAGASSRALMIVPTAANIHFRVVDQDGEACPARLVVRGIPPTTNPDLGPYHSASGAANVACTATGIGALTLPPGRYAVLATRGPEYDVHEETLDVTAAEGATLRATLPRVVDTSGWVAADLHLHADPSGDSDVSLPDRVTALLAEGVELAVATDHNHVTDYAPAVRGLDAGARISTLPGVEVTTSRWGHFNAYPYPSATALPSAFEATPRELLPWIRGAVPGVLIQVNHPRMGDIGYFNQVRLDANGASPDKDASLDFDLIEVWNGFDLAKLDTLDQMLAEWMHLIARGHRRTAVGNSDSHRIAYQWAGYPRTYIRTDDSRVGAIDWSSVASALRAGRVIVTSGPFIDLEVAGEPPGALVKANAGSVEIAFEVRSPPWMPIDHAEIWLDGALWRTLDRGQLARPAGPDGRVRLAFTSSVPIQKDAFLLVIVRGASTLHRVLPGTNVVPVAFTNPVLIDADGDGSFAPTPVTPPTPAPD